MIRFGGLPMGEKPALLRVILTSFSLMVMAASSSADAATEYRAFVLGHNSQGASAGVDVQVGTDLIGRAYVWHNTADSRVDLTPVGYSTSAAYGVSGTQVVGVGGPVDNGAPGSTLRGLIWELTANQF